jgi:UPF0716 protein FxsA
MFLLIAFIIVPLAELWAIGQVSASVGLGWTLLLLLADSVAGAYLVKREGRRAWTAFHAAITAGKWPGDEVAQGGLILVGGALLLTPGFLTDGFGLFLILPPTRALIAAVVKKRIVPVPVQMAGEGFGRVRNQGGTEPQDTPGTPGPTGGPTVFDVEVVSVERDEPDALEG